MRFLTDVNASGILAQWLSAKGHNVVKVASKNPTMTDDEILKRAVAEDRIIVTTDNDFEEMIWRQQKPHCGVLRLDNVPRIERKILLETTLELYSQELLSGAIVIAQKKKYRTRRYPQRQTNGK